jgi:uncharacterized surface anchored protein
MENKKKRAATPKSIFRSIVTFFLALAMVVGVLPVPEAVKSASAAEMTANVSKVSDGFRITLSDKEDTKLAYCLDKDKACKTGDNYTEGTTYSFQSTNVKSAPTKRKGYVARFLDWYNTQHKDDSADNITYGFHKTYYFQIRNTLRLFFKPGDDWVTDETNKYKNQDVSDKDKKDLSVIWGEDLFNEIFTNYDNHTTEQQLVQAAQPAGKKKVGTQEWAYDDVYHKFYYDTRGWSHYRIEHLATRTDPDNYGKIAKGVTFGDGCNKDASSCTTWFYNWNSNPAYTEILRCGAIDKDNKYYRSGTEKDENGNNKTPLYSNIKTMNVTYVPDTQEVDDPNQPAIPAKYKDVDVYTWNKCKGDITIYSHDKGQRLVVLNGSHEGITKKNGELSRRAFFFIPVKVNKVKEDGTLYTEGTAQFNVTIPNLAGNDAFLKRVTKADSQGNAISYVSADESDDGSDDKDGKSSGIFDKGYSCSINQNQTIYAKYEIDSEPQRYTYTTGDGGKSLHEARKKARIAAWADVWEKYKNAKGSITAEETLSGNADYLISPVSFDNNKTNLLVTDDYVDDLNHVAPEGVAPEGWNGNIGSTYKDATVGADSYLYSPANNKKQVVEKRKSISIKVVKTGYDNIPVSDAVYGIYSDADCKNLVTKVTTDSDGVGSTGDLFANTNYWVKEIEEPADWLIDQTVHGPYSVNDSSQNSLTFTANPIEVTVKEDSIRRESSIHKDFYFYIPFTIPKVNEKGNVYPYDAKFNVTVPGTIKIDNIHPNAILTRVCKDGKVISADGKDYTFEGISANKEQWIQYHIIGDDVKFNYIAVKKNDGTLNEEATSYAESKAAEEKSPAAWTNVKNLYDSLSDLPFSFTDVSEKDSGNANYTINTELSGSTEKLGDHISNFIIDCNTYPNEFKKGQFSNESLVPADITEKDNYRDATTYNSTYGGKDIEIHAKDKKNVVETPKNISIKIIKHAPEGVSSNDFSLEGAVYNIYDKDPSKYSDASILDSLTIEKDKNGEYSATTDNKDPYRYIANTHYFIKEDPNHVPFGFSVDNEVHDVYLEDKSTTISARDWEKKAAQVIVDSTEPLVSGTFNLHKYGEMVEGWDSDKHDFTYKNLPLDGAEFTIYADGDIHMYGKDTSKKFFSDGETVGVITTGKDVKFTNDCNGIASYTLNDDKTIIVNLPIGDYRVVETKVPEGLGYDHDRKEWNLSFKWTSTSHQNVLNSTEATDKESNLKVYNGNEFLLNTLVKVDKKNNAPVPGAVFGLYTKDDIYNYEGKLIVPADTLLNTFTTNATGSIVSNMRLPIKGYSYISGLDQNNELKLNTGNYYFKEFSVSDSYYLDKTPVDFTVNYKDAYTHTITFSAVMMNTPTTNEISKTDITGDKEVNGAVLKITDQTGKEIISWVTGDKNSVKVGVATVGAVSTNSSAYVNLRYSFADNGNLCITGLHHDEDYTLTETRPADGYVTAKSITYKLKSAPVSATNSAVSQAAFRTIVSVKNDNGTYTDKTDDKVIMKDDQTHIRFLKLDKTTGQALGGAKFRVTDSNGKEIMNFTTSDEVMKFDGKFKVGETYTFNEVSAPQGYEIAKAVKLIIKDTSDVQKLTVYESPTTNEISKTDITGDKEVNGAVLKITDQTGKEIISWVTGDKNSVKVGVATVGAVSTNSSAYVNLRYSFADNGNLCITGLHHDEDYTLTETRPADGYVTAKSITYKLKSAPVSATNSAVSQAAFRTIVSVKNDNGTYTDKTDDKVIMKDDQTHIRFLKLDKTTGQALGGAKFRVTDSNGKEIMNFTTSDEVMKFDGKFKVGETYTFNEVSAPQGYKLAKAVKLIIKDTSDVQKLTISDEKIPITPETPQTGVKLHILPLVIELMLLLGGVLLLLRTRKKCIKD